jgi:hypothetical protein
MCQPALTFSSSVTKRPYARGAARGSNISDAPPGRVVVASIELDEWGETAVDPDKRLVARELEARWEAALAHVAEIEERIAHLAAERPSPSRVDRDALLSLAHDLHAAWMHQPRTREPSRGSCAFSCTKSCSISTTTRRRCA